MQNLNTKLLQVLSFCLISQSGFAATKAIDVLTVTTDTDPTVYTLKANVNPETLEIVDVVFVGGKTPDLKFDLEDLEDGKVLKRAKFNVPVTEIKVSTDEKKESASSSISSFFSSPSEEKPVFTASEGGKLDLIFLRMKTGLANLHYSKLDLEMAKHGQDWKLFAETHGARKEFDGLKFIVMKKKDLDKDFLASGLSLFDYAEKLAHEQEIIEARAHERRSKIISELNEEIGIRQIELTNESKRVETLETKSLPGA